MVQNKIALDFDPFAGGNSTSSNIWG